MWWCQKDRYARSEEKTSSDSTLLGRSTLGENHTKGLPSAADTGEVPEFMLIIKIATLECPSRWRTRECAYELYKAPSVRERLRLTSHSWSNMKEAYCTCFDGRLK